MQNVFSQEDTTTVRIPVQTANKIIYELKELDTLRVANRLNNRLIVELDRKVALQQSVIAEKNVQITALYGIIGIHTRKDQNPLKRLLNNTQDVIIGFAAGVITTIGVFLIIR